MSNIDIEWESEPSATYVACCYGPEGDQPGDCSVRVGQDAEGQYWFDDGDEVVRCDTYGPFPSREEALAKALDLALRLDEGDGGDAEATLVASLEERAGDPDPDGDWAVYWDTVGDDAHVVARYATWDAADAAAELCNRELHKRHPGQLRCGYCVRRIEQK